MTLTRPIKFVTFTYALSLLTAAVTASGAFADGGFSTRTESSVMFSAAPPTYGAVAADSITVTIAGEGVQYRATTEALAFSATIVPGVSGLAGTSSVGSYDARVDGPLSVVVQSTGVNFAKGTNILSKTRTETNATLIVNGKAYIVADEVAVAVGRTTQFGSTAGAGTNATVSIFGNNYSADTIITSKGVR